MRTAFFSFLGALLFPILGALADDGRDRVPLVIERSSGEALTFQVEIADEPDERRQGLMFREEMASDHGMLFDFIRPQKIIMWMRNTPLPLDMIFADRTGRIVHIHEGAVPYSEATISSRRRARFVLEINAGVVDDLGIAIGDRLSLAE